MPRNEKGELLRIGELAKLTGENTPTLNYWTTIGVLKYSDTLIAGKLRYRLYSPEVVKVIKKIRKLQGKGSLKAMQAKMADKQ